MRRSARGPRSPAMTTLDALAAMDEARREACLLPADVLLSSWPEVHLPDDEAGAPKLTVSDANFSLYPMVTGQTRLQRRFYDEASALAAVRAQAAQAATQVADQKTS